MNRCVIPLYSIRSRRKGYEVSTMKVLMDLAGMRGGPVRPPLVTVTETEREELRKILEAAINIAADKIGIVALHCGRSHRTSSDDPRAEAWGEAFDLRLNPLGHVHR